MLGSIAQPLAITLDDIDLSLISALIGLAVTIPVTYLIVDRVVARHDRKKLEPVEKLAKERLRSKLGVGFLTTFLITLVIDITSATEDKKGLSKEVISLHIEKLKGAQSDLEMLLGVYNHVLDVKTTHLTSSIILFIEHLQEDFEYLSQIYPKPPTRVHASHIEDVILKTVKLTKEELEVLGTDNIQIRALEEWLTDYRKTRVVPSEPQEIIEVSGKHQIR
jgi:hypothetical protein